MYGLPEQGKAARAIDGALDHVLTYRKRIALEETERASTEWALVYVSECIDTMVTATLADRQRFAREIRSVITDMGIAPMPEPRTVTRPAELEHPPAEGDWALPTNIHVGED